MLLSNDVFVIIFIFLLKALSQNKCLSLKKKKKSVKLAVDGVMAPSSVMKNALQTSSAITTCHNSMFR